MLCDKPQEVDTRGGTAKGPKGEGRRVLTFRSIHAFKARLSPYRTWSRTSLRESALLLLSHFVDSRETGSTDCDEDPVGPRFPERVEALGPTADGESTRSDASLLSKPFCVCADEVGLSGVIVAPTSSELSPSLLLVRLDFSSAEGRLSISAVSVAGEAEVDSSSCAALIAQVRTSTACLTVECSSVSGVTL